jgi:hypothetical protein
VRFRGFQSLIRTKIVLSKQMSTGIKVDEANMSNWWENQTGGIISDLKSEKSFVFHRSMWRKHAEHFQISSFTIEFSGTMLWFFIRPKNWRSMVLFVKNTASFFKN